MKKTLDIFLKKNLIDKKSKIGVISEIKHGRFKSHKELSDKSEFVKEFLKESNIFF